MFSEAVGELEQVGFKPSLKLSSTYQWLLLPYLSVLQETTAASL